MFRGVRDKFEREVPQWLRPPGKPTDPRRDDDPSGFDDFPISQRQLKPRGVGFDVQDLPLVQIRHNLALEPVAIADEMIQRDRSAELAADRLAVGIQGQRALWIRNV